MGHGAAAGQSSARAHGILLRWALGLLQRPLLGTVPTPHRSRRDCGPQDPLRMPLCLSKRMDPCSIHHTLW